MEKDAQPIYFFRNVVETMKTYGLAALFAFGVLLFLSGFINYALFYYVCGILFLASVFAPIVSRWRPKKRISIDCKAVFISGCDRGFGYMLAQRLDDIGFHVFAGCLFPEGVGAESLRKSGSKRLHVIGLDVTSDSSIQKAVAYVEENLGDNGCDRGFGYTLAQRLDDIGFHVFAGCLFPEGTGAESLRKSGSKRLHVIGLDVTSDSSIQKAVTYLEENLGDNVLWAVVNNAGIFEAGELCWVSTESVIKTVDVNTLGVVRLTKAVLPKLKESHGRVVAVASIGGRISLPNMVPYCMSKAAVIALCDGLRRELYKWNIHVITIEPIIYRTLLTNVEEITKNSRQLWTSAPKNVKDLYGSDCIIDKLNSFYGCLKYFMREPTEVVSVIEDAITVLYPKYSYAPGSAIVAFCVWISKVLPKTVVDIIMHVAVEFIT